MAVSLRPSARAIILDESNRILLCRFAFSRDGRAIVVWAAPGGGVEPGETLHEALRRELLEEVGLELAGDWPHVWHQEVVRPGHAVGFDGVINDYFLVRTVAFSPSGALGERELAAENISGFRWWTHAEIAEYRGTDLFSPRGLAAALGGLLTDGPPPVPAVMGL
ncbi:MAG TPA: NUDIX domain-containing protein [Streptosporangiaceae bacterium]|nr:NUDIX domain-containing protein [Streptosporangiaceae bacterium]